MNTQTYNVSLFVPDKMEERESAPDHGVPDMTMMPEITEQAINDNLKTRYIHDLVYVSFSNYCSTNILFAWLFFTSLTSKYLQL